MTESEKAELERCPFDDGQGLHGGIVVRDNGEKERWPANVWWMRCKCGAEGPKAANPAQARLFWNRRGRTERWADEIMRLRARVASLKGMIEEEVGDG